MQRRDLAELAGRVETGVDAKLESYFPQRCVARVKFTMRDGRIIEKTVLDTKGTPAKPMSRADIESRFLQITSGIIASGRQKKIVDVVFALGRDSRLSKLTDLLGA